MNIKVFDIIRKDLKIILSDKKALALMIIMPMVLTTILSFALKGAFNNEGIEQKMNIAVVKGYDKEQDETDFLETLKGSILFQGIDAETRQGMIKSTGDFNAEQLFFKDFLESEELKQIIDYRVTDIDTAYRLLSNKEITAFIVLPEHFTYNMKINLLTPFRNRVDIRVIGEPEQKIAGSIVQNITESFCDRLSTIIIGKNAFLETALEHDIDSVYKGMENMAETMKQALNSAKVSINEVSAEERKELTSFGYYAAAMMTMFILFAAGYGGKLLLEEKQNITFQRMIIAGTSRLSILTGKFFTIFLFAIIQMSVMIIYSGIVLRINWGNWLLVILISLIAALAVAGVGLMIAVSAYITGSENIANLFNTVIIQSMALLGGSFIPVELLPSFMQRISCLSLNGIALKSYIKVMRGYGFGDIDQYLLALALIGTLFALLAVLIFNGKGGNERWSA